MDQGKYQILKFSFITLNVFDVIDSELTILVDEEKSVAFYELEFDRDEFKNGFFQ